ncbi:3-oxoacyl-synth, partial [Neoconidiobolus thromboides FSU 785]
MKFNSILYQQITSNIRASQRRVVVTGMGIVSPLGVGKSSFKNLINSESGISSYTPEYDFPSKVAARVPTSEYNPYSYEPFIPLDYMTKGDLRSMPLFIQYAIATATMALKDAGLDKLTEDQKERMGVCFGSGIGSLLDTGNVWDNLKQNKYSKITPFYVPRILTNMAAGHISIRFGLQGPNHSVSTACTTGAHSLGDAFRFIQYGDADIMVAGGTEASIHELSLAGFSRAKSLSTKYNASPKESSRPFDSNRDGFVIGEGAGAVILEELTHAKARGATIYAELKGYGLSGDAYHMTAPHESGRGAIKAMKRALETGGVEAAQVDYINAHATSTEKGDAIENFAIKQVFQDSLDKLAVSSNKGAIGHLLGAAGAVEAIFTILSIYESILPPTLNLHNPGEPNEDFNLNYVPLIAQKNANLKIALSNSFGFGGTNASLCFSKF